MKIFIKRIIHIVARSCMPVLHLLYTNRFSNIIRQSFRMAYWQTSLAQLGNNTLIYPHVIMHCPDKISIGSDVAIAEFVHMWGNGGIKIGNGVMIASHTVITTQTHEVDPAIRRTNISKCIVIEDNVWIGAHAVVMPGITIGKNAVVAAGSIVTKNVPSNCVVAGVPAVPIKSDIGVIKQTPIVSV